MSVLSALPERKEGLTYPPDSLPYYYTPSSQLYGEQGDVSMLIQFPEPQTTVSVSQAVWRYVHGLVGTLLGGKAYRVDLYTDDLYGTVVKVTAGLPAREALELWLKIIGHLKDAGYDAVVAVEWLGDMNVSEDELVDYAVKIMLESGMGPKALPGFDAVKVVQEEREG